MNTTLDKETIKIFLKICQKEIAKGNCHLINRNLDINGKIINTKQALLDIGIMNKTELWQHILELNEKNCIKIDFDYNKKRDNNAEIYVFIKKINKKDIYIKLTMRESGVICLSFHLSYKKESGKYEKENVLF